MTAFAAIDSGTNTFRLLIAKPSTDGKTVWHTLHYGHCITRLGEGLHHTGHLSEAGIHRAIAAYHEFASALRQFKIPAERTLAVATAAVREAANGETYRQRVKEETGINLQVIDGDTEASWSLCGACSVLNPDLRDAISRKLGVVKLFEAYLHSDPPADADYQALMQAADAHLAEVEKSWPDHQAPKHLIGTAGTITTLAATHLGLREYDADKINNHRINKSDFLQLRDRLLALTHAQRAAIPSIEAGRADLIIAGLAIIEAVMKRWHYDDIFSVDASLLEGIWLQVSAA